jgi:hypothetical protein
MVTDLHTAAGLHIAALPKKQVSSAVWRSVDTGLSPYFSSTKVTVPRTAALSG